MFFPILCFVNIKKYIDENIAQFSKLFPKEIKKTKVFVKTIFYPIPFFITAGITKKAKIP